MYEILDELRHVFFVHIGGHLRGRTHTVPDTNLYNQMVQSAKAKRHPEGERSNQSAKYTVRRSSKESIASLERIELAIEKLRVQNAKMRELAVDRFSDNAMDIASEMLQRLVHSPPGGSRKSCKLFTRKGMGAEIAAKISAAIPYFGDRANQLVDIRSFRKPFFGTVDSLRDMALDVLETLESDPDLANNATPELETAFAMFRHFELFAPFYSDEKRNIY